MKKISIIAVLITTGFLSVSFSQFAIAQSSDLPVKKIEVVGSAEMEVTPDEIYFSISLREYMKDGKNKVSIDKLEKDLITAVNKAGIRNEDFQVENVYGFNWDWEKKKPEEFLARKKYRLKLNDLSKINQIIAGVDQKGIEYVNIGEFSHSKIEDYKMELKAKALNAAKEKASFLLASIGEEAGNVIEVTEIHEGYAYPMQDMRMMAKESMDMAGQEVDFKKVKLKYEMKAVFAIK